MKGVDQMICDRCTVDMESYHADMKFEVFRDKNRKDDTLHEIPCKSIHVCPACGKIEFSICEIK